MMRFSLRSRDRIQGADRCLVILLASLFLLPADAWVMARTPGESPDIGILGKSIRRISEHLRFSAHAGSPDTRLILEDAVREALGFTRQHQDAPLDPLGWTVPVYTIFQLYLTHGQPAYQESEDNIRELFRLLQNMPDENKERAIGTLGMVMRAFFYHWEQTGNLLQALHLFAQVESWASSESQYARIWILHTGMLYPRVLLRKKLLPIEQRKRILDWNEHRLSRIIQYETIDLAYRTQILTQWANAHYMHGDGTRAHQLMQQWWRLTDRNVTDPLFLAVWMKILCHEIHDMEMAGQLLEHANTLLHETTIPANQQLLQQIGNYYYTAIQLPDYEIRRLRYLEVRDFVEEQELIRQTHEERQARMENR